MEAAAHRHFQASSDWHKVCQQLDLVHDKVTLEQLINATLSWDPGVQVARLGGLFRTYGLTGASQAVEGSDLVAVIAGQAPQDERERQIVYQSAVSRNVAMICAEGSTGPGRTPQVTALLSGSFHYASIQELRRHVSDWLIAYNFAKQLKALKFRTPYEAIAELWKSKPDVFIVKPTHHMLGPNT